MHDIFCLPSPIGQIELHSQGGNITNVHILKEGVQTVSQICCGEPSALMAEAARQLGEYFANKRTGFDLPLALPENITDFQRAVLGAISAIPYGQTVTYSQLALAIGRPGAVRAVGTACGRNPLPILIPCHRVIAASGLGGYAFGPEVKLALLMLEGCALDNFL